MNRSLFARIAAGTLGPALIALAATGAVHTAYAGGGDVGTSTTPIAAPAPSGPIGINVAIPKPDLVVDFEKVACGWYPESGLVIEAKVRVINKANTPAVVDFLTDVKLDGVMMDGAPKVTAAPFYTTQVFHLYKEAATPGLHVLTALTDSTGKIAESNETNNADLSRVVCPAP